MALHTQLFVVTIIFSCLESLYQVHNVVTGAVLIKHIIEDHYITGINLIMITVHIIDVAGAWPDETYKYYFNAYKCVMYDKTVI